MASLLEAANVLLDFEGLWQPYSPLSPAAVPALLSPPLSSSSLPSDCVAAATAATAAIPRMTTPGSDDNNDADCSAVMMSFAEVTSPDRHHPEQVSLYSSTSTESCTDLFSTLDFAVLASSSSSSSSSSFSSSISFSSSSSLSYNAFGEEDAEMNGTADSSSSSSSCSSSSSSSAVERETLGVVFVPAASPKEDERNGGDSEEETGRGGKRPSAETGKTRRRPTSVNNTLPPCRVCSDAASGFHYGVNTCEACKRFFRRALKRKRLFKCKGKKTCSLQGKKNKNHLCGHCRLTRCLAVGMSRTNIKTGRYTHEKRAQDSREVQHLAEKSSLSSSSSSSTTTTSSSSSSSSAASSPGPDIGVGVGVTAGPALPAMPEAEVTETVRKLIQAHAEVLTNARVPRDAMLQRAAETAEEFQLRKDVFGIQDSLTPEQYDEVFRETGLDVDERQKLMKFVAKSLDIFIQGYVHFGKGVPGFDSLSLADQANLLKLARVEVWFLGAYKGFLKDYDVFYAPNNDVRHRLEMERLLGKDYVDLAYRLAGRLQAMDLSFQEVVVLKAVCLTFTDRCQMQDAGKVEAIQWRMLSVFLHLLARRRKRTRGRRRSSSSRNDDDDDDDNDDDHHGHHHHHHHHHHDHDHHDRCCRHTGQEEEPAGLFHKVVDCLVAMRDLTELSRKALAFTYFTDAIRNHAALFDLILV